MPADIIDDDDAPPELVDVSALPDSEKPNISKTPSTTLDTPAQDRVPITLVTGITLSEMNSLCLILTTTRLSRCGQDYLA